MKKIDVKFDLEHYLRHKYILLKATFCPKWEASVNVRLGEGGVGSFPPVSMDIRILVFIKTLKNRGKVDF